MEIKDGGILLSLKNGTRDTQQVVAGKFLSNLRAELEAFENYSRNAADRDK